MRPALPAALLAMALLPCRAAGPISLGQIDRDFGESGELLAQATVTVRGEGAMNGLLGSSGVVLSADGYILSDADASLVRVEPAPGGMRKVHGPTATVRFPNGKTFPAEVVKRDEANDLCLLKLDPKGQKLRAVPPGASSDLGVGSWTLVCGNSFGTAYEREPSVSLGVLCAARDGFLYTSAAVNPGSNGGPCVDAEGRLVGIVSTWEADRASPLYGFGRILPLERARKALSGLPEAARLFPDPASLPPRNRHAAVLEEAFRILARRGRACLVSLVFRRPAGIQRTETVQPPQGPPATLPRYGGAATGFLYDADGHILTAASNLWAPEHIRGATAYLPDGRELPARLLGRDLVRGIALLKVEARNLPCLEPAPTEGLRVGQFAFALGNPWGAAQGPDPLFTMGVVSALHQLDANRDAVQTDAGMTDGNVGGPLLDLQGRLVGVCTLQSPERFGRNSGIAFAIPVHVLRKALPVLQAGRNILPGYLGVQMAPSPDGRVQIASVVPGSAAEKAGLRAGDVVTAFRGDPIANPAQLADLIASCLAGDRVSIEVLRDGAAVPLEAVLGERPES